MAGRQAEEFPPRRSLVSASGKRREGGKRSIFTRRGYIRSHHQLERVTVGLTSSEQPRRLEAPVPQSEAGRRRTTSFYLIGN
ncbi:hypothetical protein OJAV_G00208880 [Oryzias javanicus]|uniref:Uncharacterized protein n=1 Tax=Oryzias javanicus TaxID=123683 RepID=A0A3S2TYC4_ORYJA|nr:hypothetical protein OJAV_G00208880 [Oryzias javanicus]